MRKIITILAITISALFTTAKAEVYYRGFVDATGALGNCNAIFSTTHGIQITPNFFVGVGIGTDYSLEYEDYRDYYDYDSDTCFTLDVSLRIRTDIPISNRWRFYAQLDPGVSLLRSYSESDFMITGGVGFRYSLNNRLGLNIGITGGGIIDGKYVLDYNWMEYKENNWLTGVTVGIDF